jgi:hypothetical protein
VGRGERGEMMRIAIVDDSPLENKKRRKTSPQASQTLALVPVMRDRKMLLDRYLFMQEIFFGIILPTIEGENIRNFGDDLGYLSAITHTSIQFHRFTFVDLMCLLECFPTMIKKVMATLRCDISYTTFEMIAGACCASTSPRCSIEARMILKSIMDVQCLQGAAVSWQTVWDVALAAYDRHPTALYFINEMVKIKPPLISSQRQEDIEIPLLRACENGHTNFARHLLSCCGPGGLTDVLIRRATRKAISHGRQATYDMLSAENPSAVHSAMAPSRDSNLKSMSQNKRDGDFKGIFKSVRKCFAMNPRFAERICLGSSGRFTRAAILGDIGDLWCDAAYIKRDTFMYCMLSTGTPEAVKMVVEKYGISRYSCMENRCGTCTPLRERLITCIGRKDLRGVDDVVSICKFLCFSFPNLDVGDTYNPLSETLAWAQPEFAVEILDRFGVQKEHVLMTNCSIVRCAANANNVAFLKRLVTRYGLMAKDLPLFQGRLCPFLEACSRDALECAVYLHRTMSCLSSPTPNSWERSMAMSRAKDSPRVLEWLVLCIGIPESLAPEEDKDEDQEWIEASVPEQSDDDHQNNDDEF